MKVSLNWIKQFTDVALPVDKLVEKIGAQLGAVEEVINLAERYRGIVVVKVVECKKLEGSDHLSVCRVDDGGKVKDVERGEDGLVQVVCGAPNVKGGMLVAWLPPGVTVPSSWDGEKFVLEAREIRGQKSNGMLASAKELAIGDSHEGLLELDEGKPGDDFAKTYKLDDCIIDIENKMFTHRPDLFGMLGVAREIAGIQNIPFTSPDWYLKPQASSGNGLELEIKNELPELVPRFMAVTIKDVQVAPSPIWLQTFLSRCGIRPINNIVDITNYMMVLTAQPLHAYDYDKVKALGDGKATIVIRNPHSNEKLKLLNGKEIEPRAEAILIATDKQAIGLGGVMGGSETEVSADTKNIILECANFDMYSIRRTSMAHGIFSDAVSRFTKGQSPLQNPAVLAKAVEELLKVAGGQLASEVIDDNHVHLAVDDMVRGRSLTPKVSVNPRYINERLGLDLGGIEMAKLLKNVEFNLPEVGDDSQEQTLDVMAPFWRTDIELREDVVEEVGRLYGYDHLPLELPKRDLTPAAKDPLLETKAQIREVLSKAGANEVLTYSFVHGNLLEKAGQDPEQAYGLSNALSPDLQYYRLSLTPSLLDKVHPNIKAKNDEFVLFELGKSHNQNEADKKGLPKEVNALSLVFAVNDRSANKYAGAPYYYARKYLMNLLDHFGVIFNVGFESLDGADLYDNPWITQMVAPFEPGRSAVLRSTDGLIWGVVGEYKAGVHSKFKLPALTAGFEVDPLLFMQRPTKSSYTQLPKYPSIEQDISLKVPASMAYEELFLFVWQFLREHGIEKTYFTTEPIDIYQREDDKEHKQITLRIALTSYERTLTDKEVNGLLDKVAEAAKSKFGAERL